MQNIVLTGLPGAGKSTSGILAAKGTGMSFTDTDLLIQEREKMLLQDIIDIRGAEAFLAAEEAVLTGLRCRNTLIATGGSAVYSSSAMENLKRLGHIIYLQVEVSEIERRLSNIKTRGIVMAGGQTIGHLAEEREPLYEQYADSVIHSTSLSVEETAAAITQTALNLRRGTENA